MEAGRSPDRDVQARALRDATIPIVSDFAGLSTGYLRFELDYSVFQPRDAAHVQFENDMRARLLFQNTIPFIESIFPLIRDCRDFLDPV
jgi:hypothetical protein